MICSGGARRLRAGLCGGLVVLLSACAADHGALRGDVPECAEPDSAACATAREGLQQVRYPTMTVDRLVAAASRALGDLNFETSRDDARAQVGGSYVASAPVHPRQLDELFRSTLKHFAPSLEALGLTAQAEVQGLPGSDVGGIVRLRLYRAGDNGAALLIDSVAPYQVFFRQLGVELGAAPTPVEDDSDRKKHKPQVAPSISGV